MHKVSRLKHRWPKGTWMRLKSPNTLRALMEQGEFSFGRLARYAGCSKGFISHLLAGRRSSCTPELGARIAEALDVPVMVLFDVQKSTSTDTNDKQRMTSDERRTRSVQPGASPIAVRRDQAHGGVRERVVVSA